MRRASLAIALGVVTWSLAAPPAAAGGDEPTKSVPDDLTELSLEELMSVEVTSVARKEQKLAETPSAVYVITQEDIRRSTARSVPDLLRSVPGLEVAQVNANQWAISARGFNLPFANKLLVLIDGRSVYTPLFSGVYWDVQDVLLEDVERIEVIRGPGATVWGANAVNGVINIITKSAKDTQGVLLNAGGGTEEKRFGGVRYGGQLGEDTYFRVYGKYFARDHFVDAADHGTSDQWDQLRGGFRIDKLGGDADHWTLQGDVYQGDASGRQTVALPPGTTYDDLTKVAGGNLLGRWTHELAAGSETALQLYFDRTLRVNDLVGEQRNTADLDFQHHYTIDDTHDLVWGLGYRFTEDTINETAQIKADPTRRRDSLFSAFVQDDVTLLKDRLHFIVGSKFEHNDYSGYEYQPSTRLLWTPGEHHTIWAAVSRAVRTPNRVESDFEIDFQAFTDPSTGLPGVTRITGNSGFDSEVLVAYEAGYRMQVSDRWSADLATFYHVYDRLFTLEPGAAFLEPTPAPPHIVVPLFYDNLASGVTYGAELASQWQVTDAWRLRTAYTFLIMQLHQDADSASPFADSAEGDVPVNQVHMGSFLRLPWDLELDAEAHYVGPLSSQNVPSYIRLDTRIGWHATDRIELSLGVQNIVDDRHPEFGSTLGEQPTESQRSIYGMITCRF